MKRMTRRTFFSTAGIATTVPVLGAIAGHAQSSGELASVEKDVVFGKGGDMDLKCDIYRPPAGTEKRMATIHLHGGGFAAGNKESLSERVRPLAARGYVSIASQYRLTGHPEFAEACAHLADLFIDRHVINPRTYPPFRSGGGGRA